MTEFQKELQELINRYSQESGSDTPDWILAEYLADCLAAFDTAVIKCEQWYGREQRIDTGDIVFHVPTKQKWQVACVQDDKLSWLGWPEGTAQLSDCELLAKATPESREILLREMAAMAGDDHRKRYAERRLSQEHGDNFPS